MDGLGGYRTRERGSNSPRPAPQPRPAGRRGLPRPPRPGHPRHHPGSGAGHLGLFGYDPLLYEIGRGASEEAAGIGFELQPGDVAARVNFSAPSTPTGYRQPPRRPAPTEEAAGICDLLVREISSTGSSSSSSPSASTAACWCCAAPGLDRELTDTDPQREACPARPGGPLAREAKRTAELVGRILDQARSLLAGGARFLLLRGFDSVKEMPSFPTATRSGLAIAAYPMCIGISRLLGFETHQVDGAAPEEVDALAVLPDHDFVFMHIKKTDSAGEDGDFERKVEAIEEVDALIPRMLDAGVEVLAVTGDPYTPAQMAAHSWHPVPVLLWAAPPPPTASPPSTRSTAARGSLGRFEAKHLLPSCSRPRPLTKYGA